MIDALAPSVQHRHADVAARIAAAARRAGRAPEDVTLVAASKRQPAASIDAALEAGQRVFGENRVQEAYAHWGERNVDGLELHLIGPLQTNKALDAVRLFHSIQTLDRPKLARHIARASEAVGRAPELFVQVNTGEEPQKSGVLPADLDAFMKQCRQEFDLHPCGLMCIPPVEQSAGAHFWLLGELAERVGVEALSMGMSADFEVAVELGATHVRVGSGVFGAREG